MRTVQNRIGSRFPRRYKPKATGCRLRDDAQEIARQCFDLRAALFPSRIQPQHLKDIGDGQFRFLNETRNLRLNEPKGDGLPLNWDPKTNRLWRFHLQSHEHLIPLVASGDHENAWRIIESWIRYPKHRNPFSDPDAWHPFCISRRLPVWILIAAMSPPAANLESCFWRSAAEQTQWLADHLELDLGGNHLLENLHTLILATTFLDGDWSIDQSKIHRLLERELSTQILDSGEHFEKTPTYHAIMLLAIREIRLALEFSSCENDSPLVKRLMSTEASMASFLANILHPDKQVPLLGDSALEETPDPMMLLSVTRTPRDHPKFTNGYWTWRSADQKDFLICDVGPMACDFLPAHGHCDLMTIEASLNGRRAIVDTGVHDYEVSDLRKYCRGTSAHNTLQLGLEDHADTWSSFRMGRRGHPTWFRRGLNNGVAWMAGCHDAYDHIDVPNTGRIILAQEGPCWLIVDWINGRGAHQMKSRMLLHPEVKPKRTDRGLEIQLPESPKYAIFEHSESTITLSESWYFPSFGTQIPTTKVEFSKDTTDEGFIAYSISKSDRPTPKVDITLVDDELTITIEDMISVVCNTKELQFEIQE